MKHERESETRRDPVCGMQVSHNTATDTTTWEGKTWYFCSPHCRKKFDADPANYAKA